MRFQVLLLRHETIAHELLLTFITKESIDRNLSRKGLRVVHYHDCLLFRLIMDAADPSN